MRRPPNRRLALLAAAMLVAAVGTSLARLPPVPEAAAPGAVVKLFGGS
jgi:hypothetical protein